MQWCFSQVKGAIDDDVAEGKSSDTLAQMLSSQPEAFNVQRVALLEKKSSPITPLNDFFSCSIA